MLGSFTKTATKLQEKFKPEVEEELEDDRGPLWENQDMVGYCRHCQSKFNLTPIPPAKPLWRHHCRSCGGVFCEQCCDLEGNGKKICIGCARGEAVGQSLRDVICRLLLEKYPPSRKDPLQQIVSSKMAKVKRIVDKKLKVKEEEREAGSEVYIKPSIPLPLTRGSLYGEDGAASSTANNSLPLSGYFEFVNKSSEYVAIKVLLPGGDPLFETARPSYITVPPQGYLHSTFESDVDGLELLLLHRNSYSVDACPPPIRYDTRARGADPSKMSPCALVWNFRSITIYRLPSRDRNVLLKYKGDGVTLPRHGGGAARVGVFSRLQGKRFADDKIDYNTNIASLETLQLITS